MEVKTLDPAHDELRRFPSMSNQERQIVIEEHHLCARCRARCCPNPECVGACRGLGDCFACREFQKYELGMDHQGYVPRKITGELFHVIHKP